MAKGCINARFQCLVEVRVGKWGGGQTDLDKLTAQVKREGAEIIERALKDCDGRVIGQSKAVFIVLTEE